MRNELELLRVSKEEAIKTGEVEMCRIRRAMDDCGRDLQFVSSFPKNRRSMAALFWDALERWQLADAEIERRWRLIIIAIVDELRGLRPIEGGRKSLTRPRKTGTSGHPGGWMHDWEDQNDK